MFRQVAILGTGLMGGSLAAALRARLPGVRLVSEAHCYKQYFLFT